jgi:hypothetical protein
MDNNIQEDKVLLFLEKCINTYLDRKEQYGDWEENIKTGIKEAKEKYGKDYTTEDYLIQMMTWKVARSLDKPKEDTYIDEIIYKIFYYITKNNG